MRVEEELKTYLHVLWRFKWMIAACAIISSMVALGISLYLTPLYSAKATVRVSSAAVGASDYSYIGSLTRLSNTYVEIATSDTSLNEVAVRLGLSKLPKVEVEILPETELIEISTLDPDPAQARDIANTLATIMVEQSMQLYGGNAPTAREILEGQLKQAKVDLDIAVTDYDKALRAAQPNSTPMAGSTPIPNPDVEMLSQLVSVRQEIYGDLLLRYEAARTSEQLRANAITIVEPASLALQPSTPKLPLNIALGLVAGLAIGVILAFLFEGIDDTLIGVEEVLEMTTLSIMCQIPKGKRNPTISMNGRLTPVPAFNQLGARLLLSEVMEKSNSLLITSPEPGAGKSTVAANLSISLVDAGYRVVLLDMDFHRPRQHSIFKLPNEMGLSDYLCGKIQLDAVFQDTRSPDLRVATAGSSLVGTSDLIAPHKIQALLERVNKKADFVVIDAPAFLSTADPALIASQVDAVILVVARRGTGREQLRLTLMQLAELNSKIVGIVMNKATNSRLYTYYPARNSKNEKLIKKVKPISSERDQQPIEGNIQN